MKNKIIKHLKAISSLLLFLLINILLIRLIINYFIIIAILIILIAAISFLIQLYEIFYTAWD